MAPVAPRLLLSALPLARNPQISGAATFDSVSTLSFKVIISRALLQSLCALNSLFMSPELPAISARKAHLRREMRARRALVDAETRASCSWQICEILGDWLSSHAARRVAIYLAMPTEISLDALASELLNAGKIVCAPRINVADNSMNFTRLSDLNSVKHGAYNVREPASNVEIKPEIVLVPGLAFDRRGCRLGMGGGWYDRVLEEIPVRVGVGYSWQILDEVPVESHDIKLDWLASEAGLWKCK